MTDNSLRDKIQGNWKQLSGSVRHEWGQLTHNDVEQVKGDVEVLAGKIQEHYGVTKAEARKQIDQWASKFHSHKTEQSSSDTSADEPANVLRREPHWPKAKLVSAGERGDSCSGTFVSVR